MRTLDQIKAEMQTVQDGIPELQVLNSQSQMAFILHLKNMWALLVQLTEMAWEGVQSSTETLLANKRTGSTQWYVEQVLKFQLGDTVTVVNFQTGYEVIDASKQIIKQAACVEDAMSGRLLIKAVKAQGDQLTSLTADEVTALKAYLFEVKFAGVQVDVSSMRADQLKLYAVCKYDRQILSSTGALLADPTKYPVKDAVKAYLKAIPFNSVLSWTGLTDYLQIVPGVKDFTVTATEIAPDGTNLWASFQREVISNAGHLVLSDDHISYT